MRRRERQARKAPEKEDRRPMSCREAHVAAAPFMPLIRASGALGASPENYQPSDKRPEETDSSFI